jgi:hypothetical protein
MKIVAILLFRRKNGIIIIFLNSPSLIQTTFLPFEIISLFYYPRANRKITIFIYYSQFLYSCVITYYSQFLYSYVILCTIQTYPKNIVTLSNMPFKMFKCLYLIHQHIIYDNFSYQTLLHKINVCHSLTKLKK